MSINFVCQIVSTQISLQKNSPSATVIVSFADADPPSGIVPGTKMEFAGLKKDQEIADVIGYLKQFDAQGQQASP